ncbi:MAG: hypothetical protein OHK93_004466 [Ramalina farinacea]|uniref:Uncharacterized protein n=1 Tax=Ramalina farinacea TaxID=258253 RepID=A0AA43QVY0_9LECA|nr:hypothetical protein [Ramalina farinacea]
MKASITLMALASILPIASAAPSPAAAAAAKPQAVVDLYADADCLRVKGAQVDLVEGKCVDTDDFFSFEGTHNPSTQRAQRTYEHLSQPEPKAPQSVLRRRSLVCTPIQTFNVGDPQHRAPRSQTLEQHPDV